MSSGTLRVAVYARVSTQEQAVEGTSLDHQSDQLALYCRSQGWEIVQRYVDAGYTGKDENRPGLKHLLADAKLGLFNKVVVYKMDRLARNLRLLLEIEEKLGQHGTSFHSASEVFDTSTANGRHFLQMLGMVSEWEREAIIERTKAGRLQRYTQGCWGPGHPPYGYTYNRETKKLVINEPEARIVRRIFEEYAAGKSMWGIANILNDKGIPSRRKDGKGWRNTSVRDVLFNPAYKGAQVVNVHQERKGRPMDLPARAIVIPIPAIVSDSLWYIAQERRRTNKHLQPSKTGHWLLQGLITCGLCGRGFRAEPSHRRRRYACRGRLKYTHIDGSPRCTSHRLDADWLEEQVWQRVKAIIDDPNRLESLLAETVESLKNREADMSARTRPINARLAEIAEQKARLADDWVQLDMGTDRYRECRRDLDQEEARLKSMRSDIDPSQLEELERTRAILRFWEGQLRALAWDTEEEEEGRKSRVVDQPHRTALTIVGLDSRDITKTMGFPATRRELLDLLQVRLVVFEDRVELKALFAIDPIGCQSLHPGCRSGHCPQSPQREAFAGLETP